jgi:V/A-type H+/Na+-transporting ATPase subunit C
MGRPVILEKYPYTYLRTIIMKRNLLTKADYDKIMKMSPVEIGKYLEDFEYKKEVDELGMEYKGIELLERVLQLNLGNKFTKLMKISPHDLRLLIIIYLKRYDIYNIKTILRAKFSGLPLEESKKHISSISVKPVSYFEKLLANNTVEEVFLALDFLEEKEHRSALEHFKTKNSLVMMENVLDRHYYSFMFSQLRYLTMEGRLYKRFLLNEIDVLNVKLILRLKHEETSEQEIKGLVLNFGTITKETLDKMMKSDAAGIIKELENTDFKVVVEKYTKEPEKTAFTDLEMDLDKYLLQQSKKLIRQHPMSVDVILGYMFLKDLEVKNLNRIIKAKQLGLDNEFIEKTILI